MENLALKDKHDKIFFGQNLENLTIVLTGGADALYVTRPLVGHACKKFKTKQV